MTSPTSLHTLANGLEQHVLEWAPSRAPAQATVILVHGYMDAAATWDLVAPELASAGFRVLAPDQRGFGDGPRVPSGGYYYFPDYVPDLAGVVDQLVVAGSPLFLVGHSMGGTIVTMYAGAFPERVSRLVVIEGAGPPESSHDDAPVRLRRWIEQVHALQTLPQRAMPSREEALRRLVNNHPRVDESVLRRWLDGLARQLPDGRVVWKADPLHGTRSPMLFFGAGWRAFARRVTCPVLFVSGGPLGWHPPDEEERVTSFAALERVEIPDAGHMMHWTEPAKLTRALLRFFGDAAHSASQSP